ncbi:MAG: FkbM family methyltransferase [Terriglobales bacterium]
MSNAAEMASVARNPRVFTDLVYDVGMHNGNDTAFYLHQGYRVVAIEADPVFVEQAKWRFAQEIREGRLVILNVGIADEAGQAEFWICDDNSVWNSFDRNVAARNGSRHHALTVQTATFREILRDCGLPHYLKIDIEGNDGLCVQSLLGLPIPKYISLEAQCSADPDDSTEAELLTTLELLREAGYKRFKLISQVRFWAAGNVRGPKWLHRVALSAAHGRLRALKLGRIAMTLTGRHILQSNGYKFEHGSSGPWGEITPGPWLSYKDARRTFLRARNWHVSKSNGKYSFWFDWHATY